MNPMSVVGSSAYTGPATSVYQGDVSVQGVLRVKPAGDIGMGAFTTGPQP